MSEATIDTAFNYEQGENNVFNPEGGDIKYSKLQLFSK
jgi:hypothetical protein